MDSLNFELAELGGDCSQDHAGRKEALLGLNFDAKPHKGGTTSGVEAIQLIS
jgi:hypothetical protein